jgi:hypothetical protein
MSEQEQAIDNQGVLDEDWRDSSAKDYLYSLLVEGMIPGKDDIRPKQVFEQYCRSSILESLSSLPPSLSPNELSSPSSALETFVYENKTNSKGVCVSVCAEKKN